ncbi:alpha-L-rhamnosidase C-terminal domain-containing protein [Kitasatospora phosalacinea]|uniref:alpha-L-rhamnosidase C-terminal domain-containing protein n=1 Tax=Kitasatospora phosalacinea TaxID=2065 RepID=UPI0025566881|nr:alpha-L-rhamnosidase C-terminal domain-containing protein [Kitasatospora phosalacinea]
MRRWEFRGTRWFHRTVAGLAPAEPGYRTTPLRPRPGGGLTWAKARHAPHGTAAISWQLTDEGLTVELTAPPGCEAVLDLPSLPPATSVPAPTTSPAPAPAPNPVRSRVSPPPGGPA